MLLRGLAIGGLLSQGVVCFSKVSNSTSHPLNESRWPSGIHLAVDYYPSQWPDWMWESDVSRMRDTNISFVRVNEFDWSVLEPREGEYNFTVLDKTLDLFQRCE